MISLMADVIQECNVSVNGVDICNVYVNGNDTESLRACYRMNQMPFTVMNTVFWDYRVDCSSCHGNNCFFMSYMYPRVCNEIYSCSCNNLCEHERLDQLSIHHK